MVCEFDGPTSSDRLFDVDPGEDTVKTGTEISPALATSSSYSPSSSSIIVMMGDGLVEGGDGDHLSSSWAVMASREGTSTTFGSI